MAVYINHLEEHVEQGSVVRELDVLGLDAFPFVLILLPGKDVLVEVELQLLVGRVDAHLLKAVVLKVLKARQVQDAHTVSRHLSVGVTCAQF